jgi:hypothetical protein
MRLLALVVAFSLFFAEAARAFCGFYVARADGTLFNKASKVVLAHRGQRTVITMASDISGAPRDFALVIPVPTVVKREDVRLVASATIDHLDAYTAPRLVEYTDPDPCAPLPPPMAALMAQSAGGAMAYRRRGMSLGVRVEAQYSVGEYDIIVLSGTDSGGLLIWLDRNGYKVPAQADAVIGSYIRQNMHFFLAKVNLERHEASGSRYLRPIQVEYDSAKFMLPIRLGTVNADGPQELIAMTLTERGRVETTNYRVVRLPSGNEIPLYVKDRFGPFYKAMFERQAHDHDDSAVFLEYAWNMNFCDPCAAEPMSGDELRELGASWTAPGPNRGPYGGQPAFVTRLHVRYDRAHFPEDLALQETADTENFQARYVLRHPFLDKADCPAGKAYREELPRQFAAQARTLNELTGWPVDTIRAEMDRTGQRLP